MSQYIIVYPSGHRNRLAVVEICAGLEYEKSDYAIASRQEFDTEEAAILYAKELAHEHGKKFESDEPDYLD